ncbi:winged helix-turn-helix transcriptional regulator [Candidatus Micrarchaeota archaeon]|nr:winged helix-turn-helix transcriptional regulator [Candidatus Micrarchaeota archaeon]
MEEIDTKDRMILHALDFHAREPVTRLAKRLRMSKDVLNYRIKRLEEKGIIEGYHVVPDPTKMGNVTYKLLVKYQSMTKEVEEEMLEYLIKSKETGWVAKTEGAYDLLIIFWLPNEVVFDEFLTKFLERYGRYFYLRDMIVITAIHTFRRDYLSPKTPEKREEVFYRGSAKNICDEIDFRILDILQRKNARASNIKIGKAVGLTPEAVRYRIKELRKRGVICTFRPKIALEKIGYYYYNVMFSLKDMGVLKKIYSYALGNQNITFYVRYLGKYDLGLDIETESPERLREILEEVRALFGKAIVNYDVVRIYEELKVTY